MLTDDMAKITELTRLFQHYHDVRSDEQLAPVLEDFIADFRDVSVERFRQACQRYRTSDARFSPTPGGLRAHIAPLLAADERRSRRGQERYDAWRPATQEEYEAMTIREKVRENRILASAAGRKAGPMWKWDKEGKGLSRWGHPVSASSMPECWRIWAQRRDAYLAEAQRLQDILNARRAPIPEDQAA